MLQDERITEEALPHIDMLFEFIAGNDDQNLIRLLNVLPDLVYARDVDGSTALIALITSGLPADLETARIIMQYNPDLTMENNLGIGPWQAVHCMSKRPETSIQLVRDFLKLLDPNVKFRDYSSTSNTHELLREYMGTEDFKQSDNTLKKLASTSNDHAINNPSGGGCCTIMCVTEIVYDNPVLNQNNRNGLFPALNFNTDFDKYNFDPKALIRAEREAAGYFPHVNDATQLNFDSILPNEDAVNDGALPEQSHTIWNDSGISLAGAISLLALLVVFESF